MKKPLHGFVLCGLCVSLCAAALGASAQPLPPNLQVVRVSVQARMAVPDLVCEPAAAKSAAPRIPEADPQEPPDLQDVQAQMGTLGGLAPARGALADHLAGAPGVASVLTQGGPKAKPGQALRVAIWGDSHLAAGFLSSEWVRLLALPEEQVATQFVAANMNRAGVRMPWLRKGCVSAHWRYEPAHADAGAAAAPGPGLVSLSSAREGATLAWDVRQTNGVADRVQLRVLFQQTAEPIRLALAVDGGPEQMLTLQGEPGPAALALVADGPMSVVRLRLLQGAFRWQGMQWPVPDHARLLMDVFGYPGATVAGWQRAPAQALAPWWRDSAYDLVMLEFGTNEGNVQPFDTAAYAQTLRASVSAWRGQFAQAACVLIGPGDRGVLVRRSQKAKTPGRKDKAAHGRSPSPAQHSLKKPSPSRAAPSAKPLADLMRFTRVHLEISRLQSQVAAENGCRFWSMLDAMGGAGGAYRWASQSPAWMARDLIHFTVPGYQHLAQKFAQDMGWQADLLGLQSP